MEVFVITERKRNLVRMLLGWCLLALTIACLVLTLMGAIIMGIPCIILAVIWYLVFYKANVEFECSYFDGELRFAKIMNKSRRKRLGVYVIDEVVAIAPAGDRSVYNYENDNSVKVKDYTSGNKDVPYYDIVIKNQNGTVLIKAELDDKYLDEVSKKYRSKITARR